jgi:hypothetical protein
VGAIASDAAGQAGARGTGAAPTVAPGRPGLVAVLLAQNTLVITVRSFPFDRAAEADRISQCGHLRGS